jgi:serine/threonine protein phosphatase 1
MKQKNKCKEHFWIWDSITQSNFCINCGKVIFPMRTFAMGDIHGSYKGMIQCFERSKFNYNEDKLIVLGDVVDGWPEVKECIDELMKIKHLVLILGNHDEWFLHWLETGIAQPIWTKQGGQASINSLSPKGYIEEKDRQKYIKFFRKAKPYYIGKGDRVYVHGGFYFDSPIEETPMDVLLWDRELFETTLHRMATNDTSFRIKHYNEVFIGHTSTARVDFKLKPINFSNVWMLDQGAGWEGKLTIMDVETKEYWQSDESDTFYNVHNGVLNRR